MKYKYALNPKVRNFVEWQLEHYRDDKKTLQMCREDMMPSIISNCDGMSSQRVTVSDTTGNAAIKLTTNAYITMTERSINAIERALQKCDDTDLKIIDLVYWKRTHTPEGAGMKANISRRGAYNRINNVLSFIALEMGLINI